MASTSAVHHALAAVIATQQPYSRLVVHYRARREESKQAVHLSANRTQTNNPSKASSSIEANLVGKFVPGGLLKAGQAYHDAVHDAYCVQVKAKLHRE